MSEKQDLICMIEKLFSSKIYSLDILYDLELLINVRLKLFQDTIEEFERLRAEDYLKEIAEFTKKRRTYEFSNRIYIISGVQTVNFAAVHLSDKAMSNIISDLSKELLFCDSLPIETTASNLVSTIYMFHEKNMIFLKHIYPAYAALVLQVLSSKNILYYPVEERWNIKD